MLKDSDDMPDTAESNRRLFSEEVQEELYKLWKLVMSHLGKEFSPLIGVARNSDPLEII